MAKRYSALSAMLIGVALPLAAVAQTAEEREERLGQIYKDFYSKPTSPELWNQLTQPLQTEAYKIQPGDNLWSISEVFFGDGNYWPKVWSINSKIENPHLIEPGNEIRFRLGTAEAEPSFFITEQNTTLVSQEPDVTVVSAETEDPGVNVEAVTSYKPKPVLTDIPRSLPEWQGNVGVQSSNYDEWGVEIIKPPALKLSNRSPVQSIVVDAPAQFIGDVVEAEMEDSLKDNGKNIYVRVKDSTASEGKQYLLVQDEGKLRYKESGFSKKGQVLKIAAQLTLLDPIEVRKPASGYNYYRAKIDRSIDLTVDGYQIYPGSLKNIDYSRQGKISEEEVRVVGGRSEGRGLQFSSGNLVYLDKGSAEGVNEGDIFLIQRVKNPEFRDRDPLVKFTQAQVGQVQVVDVQNGFSTAVVLAGSSNIQSGDRNVGATR